MTNGELFKEIFGIYATELWAMEEDEYLQWLNEKAPEGNDYRKGYEEGFDKGYSAGANSITVWE